MEESKKKSIMIGIIIVCLILAGVIFSKYLRPGGSGIDIKRGQMIWLKCRECRAEYQIDNKDFLEYVREHIDPMQMAQPALVCEECGEESAYRAEKCEKCEKVFFYGAVRNDYPDRCPDRECSFSKMEEIRKQAAARRK